MQVLLVRHAIAEPAGSDAERALTVAGRREFERVAAAIATRGWRPKRILHSPLRRARETAELLGLALESPLESCAELVEAPSAELLGRLRLESVALVGHEPWMSALAAWLLTGRRDLGHAFPFERGGVALLEGRAVPGEAHLVAFLPPDALLGPSAP